MAKKKQIKKKQIDDEEQLKNISSNKILVKVFKDFGSNTAILKAEYEAEEKRDNYNNLISINKQFYHDEDTDFTIDDVYHDMAVILEFKNKNKEEKIKVIEEKIQKQEKLLVYLDKFPELNAMYNHADESLKLNDYRLLKDYTQNLDNNGSYFTIEKGKRVYSFDSVDGFLVPVWRGIATHTQYPDHTRKKKIIIQEDIILKQELQKYDINKKAVNILIWMAIIVIIAFFLNVWAGLKLLEMNSNMQEKINANGMQCVEYTSKLNMLYAKGIENRLISEGQLEEAIKGDLKTLEAKDIG